MNMRIQLYKNGRPQNSDKDEFSDIRDNAHLAETIKKMIAGLSPLQGADSLIDGDVTIHIDRSVRNASRF
jgi:hypothetical protein